MDNNYTVYMHVNKFNNKKYIGITSKKPEERWINGLGYHNQPFYNAIKKYGWDSFDHIILETELDADTACQREVFYIDYYDSVKNGYNCSYGGEQSIYYKMSDEQKQKISESKKGMYAGEKNPMYGISPQERMDLITFEKWKMHISETVSKQKEKLKMPIICVNTGKIYSYAKDVEKEYGLSWRGVAANCRSDSPSKNYYDSNGRYLQFEYYDSNKNYNLTDTILRRAKTPVICLETKNIYYNPTEAGRVLDIDPSHIIAICKHKDGKNIAKGLHFMYYKDYIENGPIIHGTIFYTVPVICKTTGEIFQSETEAAKAKNIKSYAISGCISGKQKYAGYDIDGTPLIWDYLDPNNKIKKNEFIPVIN